MKYLHTYLDEHLAGAKTSEDIHQAIYKAYDQVEKECYEKCKGAFDIGFGKAATVGACALITVISGNKLYVANAGDCEAVLLRKKPDGSLESVKVCRPFTCNDPEEQQRLKSEFPNDPNIVRCRSPDACYVKGSLMPSRAFGDFRLKHPEMNFHNNPPEYQFRQPIPDFEGPYITHKPEIREFDLTKDDVYLVLGSDGLWDEVNTMEVGKVVSNDADSAHNIGKCLFNT